MSFVKLARKQPMPFLRAVLRANAVFSALSGTAMILGGQRLGAWLGRPGSMTPDGVVLAVFAVGLVILTRRPDVSLRAAAVVVGLDALWVLDVVRQIVGGHLSTAGDWTLGVAALVVLEFAVLQAAGVWMTARPAASAPLPT